jgi:hypothetical protein
MTARNDEKNQSRKVGTNKRMERISNIKYRSAENKRKLRTRMRLSIYPGWREKTIHCYCRKLEKKTNSEN